MLSELWLCQKFAVVVLQAFGRMYILLYCETVGSAQEHCLILVCNYYECIKDARGWCFNYCNSLWMMNVDGVIDSGCSATNVMILIECFEKGFQCNNWPNREIRFWMSDELQFLLNSWRQRWSLTKMSNEWDESIHNVARLLPFFSFNGFASKSWALQMLYLGLIRIWCGKNE